MSEHKNHQMHENSLAAYQQEGLRLSTRARLIYQFMVQRHEPMTDRQVQAAMGFEERGMVQPRISELVKVKLLTEVDRVGCPKTGKPVRRTLASVHIFKEDAGGQLAFV